LPKWAQEYRGGRKPQEKLFSLQAHFTHHTRRRRRTRAHHRRPPGYRRAGA